jgi:hypothetical protein
MFDHELHEPKSLGAETMQNGTDTVEPRRRPRSIQPFVYSSS